MDKKFEDSNLNEKIQDKNPLIKRNISGELNLEDNEQM